MIYNLVLSEVVTKPDTLSAVNPAKRGTMLLARLGEVSVPPVSVASAEATVDNFFCDGRPPRRMEELQALFLLLKNNTKISPVWDGASTES
jgi:hypothetical protein